MRRLGEMLVSGELRRRAERLPRDEIGELGVDPFGYDPEIVPYLGTPVAWLYRHYFRVETFGIEQVPTDGRVMLVANHSGQLPFDGLMIGASMLLERDPPRIVRTMVERWVARLPWFSTWFSRAGQVVGTPDNCRRLLERDQAVLVFPEGIRGITKTFDQRYQLQRFGSGFMRLALETGTPVVPVAVIGGEEQAPSLVNWTALARLLSVPAFPITLTWPWLGPLGLVPLPVRYRLHFGAPIQVRGDPEAGDEEVRAEVDRVVAELEALIATGLAARKAVFR